MKLKKIIHCICLSALIIIPLSCTSCGNSQENQNTEDPKFTFDVIKSNEKISIEELNDEEDKAILFKTRKYIHTLNYGSFEELWSLLDSSSYNHETEKAKWRNDVWKKFISHHIEEVNLKNKNKDSAEVILITKNLKMLPFLKIDNTILTQSIKLKKINNQWYINNIQEIKKEIIKD